MEKPQPNKLSAKEQLENFWNSIYEDIFNADEKEIDEMLVELGYDPKKVGEDSWKHIQELKKKLDGKNKSGNA